ncbi:hypothetical protein JTB14_006980 [Gonioctena quinquepunctata]|nr:hypothetical protein JTB14_006980 [Gonioctena quinquepunctata]
MVFPLRLFQASSNLFLLCSFLLAAGFILQIKVFYINHQRQTRIEEYSKQMSALSETIDAMEKHAKQSSIITNQIEGLIESYKRHEVKTRKPQVT